MTSIRYGLNLCFILATFYAHTLFAQYDPKYPEPIAKLRGSLFLHGGGTSDYASIAKSSWRWRGENRPSLWLFQPPITTKP